MGFKEYGINPRAFKLKDGTYIDEGTSYHYIPAADYIDIKNSDIVAECMKANGIPYVQGKTWTTDSFYRETRNIFHK